MRENEKKPFLKHQIGQTLKRENEQNTFLSILNRGSNSVSQKVLENL